MGHAAGQAADCLELLGLTQLVFGGGTRLHFGGDALLQVMGQFLAQALGMHVLGGFHHNRQHPGWLLIVPGDGAVIEVQPDGFRLAVTQQHQVFVVKRQGTARQAGVDHVAIELGHLRPAQLHRRAEQVRMPAAGKHRIAVVVDHVAGPPPQHHHRHGRGQHHLHVAGQAGAPGVNRAKIRGGPIESTDTLGHFTGPAFTAVGVG